MNKGLLFLAPCIFFLLPLFGQNQQFKGKELHYYKGQKELLFHFKDYRVFEFDAGKLQHYLGDNEGEKIRLSLVPGLDWDVEMHVNPLLGANYTMRIATDKGEVEKPLTASDFKRTFKGTLPDEDHATDVRLTVDDNFLYGVVTTEHDEWFIEPLRFFISSAAPDRFVIYHSKDVIPREGTTCGMEEMQINKDRLKHREKDEHHDDHNRSSVVACYEVDLAIASDFLMYQAYNNSVTDVENHNIGVMNNVGTNWDDEFADEIQFIIVEQFVATSAASDPWTNSTNAGTVLNSFTNWGPGGFNATHDLGQFWTDRDFNGGTIGIAWLSSVCDPDRYHCLQDFSSNANLLRVLTAHEIGHNFSCPHNYSIGSNCDPPGRPSLIMDPTVNTSNEWSDGNGQCEANSINSVNNFVVTRTCLANCAPPAPPTPQFSAIFTNVCPGGDVYFIDESTGNPDAWSWSFPGGTPSSSSDQNPVITYNTPGTYAVTLTVSNAFGANSNTISGYITVGPNGQDIVFRDGFENGLGNWIIDNPDNSITWDLASNVPGAMFGTEAAFMDNFNYSASQNIYLRDALISPAIDLTGRTSATLELDYAYCRFGQNFVDSLIIYVSTDGGVSFPNRVFAGGENGSGNFATRFILNSFFIPQNANEWCYGNITPANCISVDLTPFVGNPNVVLRIENASDYGNNMYVDNVTVIASCLIPPPVAGFTASPLFGCIPLTVNYADQSTGNPDAWNWSFPGGTPPSSTMQNPSVVYNTVGTFDATLTVSNPGGMNTFTANNFITTFDVPTPFFNYSIDSNVVSFFNGTIGGTNYTWDFGDMQTSAETNPVHTFLENGIYNVTLFATNQCGTVQYSEIITITTPPVANFTGGPTSGCAPLVVTFISQASTNSDNILWLFPGGNPSSSNSPAPVVIYNDPGVFDVTMIVSNNQFADTLTMTDYITVDSFPTAGYTSSTAGTTANFTNTSSNSTTFMWDFGDNTTSMEVDPSHTYGMDGTYDVTLIATNPCGSDTVVQQVVISTQPIAAFSSNVTSGCAPLNVQFFDNSTDNTTSWLWLFPGGIPGSSMAQDPLVTYPNPGTYSVTLIISNNSGSDTLTLGNYITVNDVPVSDFTANVNVDTVQFTNQSTDATSYQWFFGDGNMSTDPDPEHGYSAEGQYNVLLIATNQCGSDTSFMLVDIILPPVAAFTADVTSGCPPLVVQFMDNSSGTVINRMWSFPGGSPASSTDPNPVVTYNTPGTYNVTLTVSNASGSTTETQNSYITVNDIPSAQFTESQNINVVQFTNQSIDANSYQWFFGDGEMSTDPDPTHTYQNDGNYTVLLIATNACGDDTTSTTINVLLPPVSNISSNVTSGCAPLVVQFMDNSSGVVANRMWSFPGGSPASSTDPNPTVTYNAPGTYTVTLTVSNASGSDSETITDYITVNGSPNAGFASAVSVDTVNFTNNSIDATSYMWDFGDMQTSADPNPSHIYTDEGNYTVTLIATNACGSDTITQQVVIILPPTPSFTADVTTGCAPLTVQFMSTSSGTITYQNWLFPGGTPSASTDPNPVVVYNTPGVYEVTLTAGNNIGENTVTETAYINVLGLPGAGFTSSPNADTVTFTNQSSDATSYFWDFGDTQTSMEVDPVHGYMNDGIYTVTLIATNTCGSDTTTQEVTVVTSLIAGFNAQVTSGCVPLVVQFSDQSSDNVVSYSWVFEGGTPATSTDPNPTVTYNTAGTFDVELTVTDQFGNTSTVTQPDYISVNDVPSASFTSAINGLDVSLTSTIQNADSIVWTFGDGNISNEPNPTHTYQGGGDFEITLTVFNECGSISVSDSITIVGPPVATFTADITSGCAPLIVQFEDLTSGPVTARTWSFPGGSPTSSTDQNPLVTYATAGSYTVTLTVTNNSGMDQQVQVNYIVVNDIPTASFTSSTNGATVDFSNQSTNADSVVYFFGDGNSSNQNDPSHTYANDGSYPVMQVAYNNCGTDTTTATIVISTPPIANFTYSTDGVCAPVIVQCTDASSINTTDWNWTVTGPENFVSNAQNPSFTLTMPGTYTIGLVASNANGMDNFEVIDAIDVQVAPSAGFIFDVNGNNVDFTSMSTGADTYFWDFGDDTNSASENPSHMYDTAGTYPVTLIVGNICGFDTIMQNVEIVPSGAAPMAGIDFNQGGNCAPVVVQFTDVSTNTPTQWDWSFPSGNPSSSTAQNPMVTYNSGGVFDVQLIASNTFGSDTLFLQEIITLDSIPVAQFGFVVTDSLVTFNNTSLYGGNYFWNFGDNEQSNLENPTHIFDSSGVYNVMLVVTNKCGVDTFTQLVMIGTTGLENPFDNVDLWVYPNPNNGNFFIDFNGASGQAIRARLYNVIGQEVWMDRWAISADSYQKQVQVGGLPAGTYLLDIEMDGHHIIEKLIISK